MYDCTINTQLDAVVLHPYQAKIIAAMLSDKPLTIFLGRKCGVTYAERIAKQIKAEMDKMQNPNLQMRHLVTPSLQNVVLPPVLDPCCSCRKFWFDPHDDRAIFCDKRQEMRVTDVGTPGTQGRKPLIVAPDLVADFTAMPFPNESFHLVVFDPPHMEKLGETGHYAMAYGKLQGDWRSELRKGFSECFRVLKPNGTLIFKWCEVEIPLREILELTQERPLFGHRSGKAAKTHWVTFLKQNPSHHAPPQSGGSVDGVVETPNQKGEI